MATFMLIVTLLNGNAFVVDYNLSIEDCTQAVANVDFSGVQAVTCERENAN